MHSLLVALVALTVNMFIGAAVLALVDDEDRQLFKWYAACPMKIIGPAVMLSLWPVMALIAWKMRRVA